MESDDGFEFQRNPCRKKPRLSNSSGPEDGFLDAILLNQEHDENIQFMCDQQDWSPIITDSVPFDEYNQKHRILPEIDYDDAFSIYRLFLSDDIIDLMVLETNKYYEKCAPEAPTIRKHKQQWKPTTRDEMHMFIGILLIMGVVKVPEMRLYWSKDPMFSNKRIKSAMSRQRFFDILHYWHFSDDQICSDDPLFEISALVEKINRNFQKAVKPGKELTIEESMTPSIVPNKRQKFGVKLYKLCLIEGYTYKIKLYSGKSSRAKKQSHSHTVVMELMDGLLYAGRILYADSYFTSIPLALELLQKKTFLCGTLQANSSLLPTAAKVKQKKGEIISVQKEGVKFMKWTDNTPVLMLTTCKHHKCSLIEHTTRGHTDVQRPDCVVSYNKAKKGVDLSDQMTTYYSSLRKTIVWYKKIILELICGTMLANAWCIYSKFGTRKNVYILNFRKAIIDCLLKVENGPSSPKPPLSHNLAKYEGSLRRTRKRCKNCYRSIAEQEGRENAIKKTVRVNTYCPACKDKPTLCMPCFAKVHHRL